MANEEQLAQFKKGVQAWNEWRSENPTLEIDLAWAHLGEADLREADLHGADLLGAILFLTDLRGANLRGANLTGAFLYGANLTGTNLRGANLSRASLSKAFLSQANLSRALLSKAHLDEVKLGEALLSEADLSEADLSEANLNGAFLSQALLSRANLTEADLGRADLRKANLSEATLTRANLRGADLSEAHLFRANLGDANLNEAFLIGSNLIAANLSRANLTKADLSGTNLAKANLSGVDLFEATVSGANLNAALLIGANLNRADLAGADLSQANVGGTIFNDLDLSEVKGLETVTHNFPSTIGIDTVYKSQGAIPEVFLRGCGLPENLIMFLLSLPRHAFDLSSCVIVHHQQDRKFCERLCADLQAKGVRTWYSHEDAKWGETAWNGIDRRMRIYDKLVVVLSEASLQSQPVLREIQYSLDREAKEHKNILFPATLDRYVFDQWAHECQADVLQKGVSDFIGWDIDAAKYDKALEKLLIRLQAKSAEDPKATG